MCALSHDQAREFYDRIGARQDSQAFYEDPATDALVEHGRFETAQRVLELGCGTGRFAAGLLEHHLPGTASYRALDISPVMVGLARERLAPFGPRAEVALSDGAPSVGEADASRDRFVSCYVLDLLSEPEIEAVIREAHRILEPGGLLCVCSLCTGAGPLSRLVARVWARVHAWRPALVGGCRPLDLLDWIPEQQWRVVHHARMAPFGVPSEVLVAERG